MFSSFSCRWHKQSWAGSFLKLNSSLTQKKYENKKAKNKVSEMGAKAAQIPNKNVSNFKKWI